MKLPRDVSGRSFAHVLVKHLSYHVVHERGSHIVLETERPSHHRIAIPDHKNLRLGTLNAIVKAVADHIGIDKDQVVSLLIR